MSQEGPEYAGSQDSSRALCQYVEQCLDWANLRGGGLHNVDGGRVVLNIEEIRILDYLASYSQPKGDCRVDVTSRDMACR